MLANGIKYRSTRVILHATINAPRGLVNIPTKLALPYENRELYGHMGLPQAQPEPKAFFPKRNNIGVDAAF